MIYVYCLTDRTDDLPPALEGIADLQPRLEVIDGIGVVYAEGAGDPPEAGADSLWRHEALVEQLMADRTVLPVRFGTTFRDAGALSETVSARAGGIARAFDKLRGRVEIGLRVLEPETVAANATRSVETGTDYLTSRVRRHSPAAVRAANEADRVLASTAEDAVHHGDSGGRFVLSAAYLIPKDRIDSFTAEVRKLASAHPEVELMCTGPWPPYNFVDGIEG